MSLLWSGYNTKLLTNQTKPSPTNHKNFLRSARNKGIHKSKLLGACSVKRRFIEGSSLFTSLIERSVLKISGGMTVEAAVVLPLFLFFFLNLGSAMEMLRFHGKLQLALWDVGSGLAMYEYALENGGQELVDALEEEEDEWWKDLVGVVLAASYVKGRLVDSLGEEYLESAPIRGG